jgi:hypothetical protein
LKAGLAGRIYDGHQHGHGHPAHSDFKGASILNSPNIFGHFVFDFSQLNLQGDDSQVNEGQQLCDQTILSSYLSRFI